MDNQKIRSMLDLMAQALDTETDPAKQGVIHVIGNSLAALHSLNDANVEMAREFMKAAALVIMGVPHGSASPVLQNTTRKEELN